MTQGHSFMLEKKAEVAKHTPERRRADVVPLLPPCSETGRD